MSKRRRSAAFARYVEKIGVLDWTSLVVSAYYYGFSNPYHEHPHIYRRIEHGPVLMVYHHRLGRMAYGYFYYRVAVEDMRILKADAEDYSGGRWTRDEISQYEYVHHW